MSLGVSREACEFLASVHGARPTATLYDASDRGAYVIEAVTVEVDGMALRAQAPARPPTPEETDRARDRAEDVVSQHFSARSCAP